MDKSLISKQVRSQQTYHKNSYKLINYYFNDIYISVKMFGHLSKQAGIPCNQKHLKDLDALSLIPIFRFTIAGIQGYALDLWWIFHLCQENGIS